MPRPLLRIDDTLKHLPALVILSLPASFAQAEELPIQILRQPLSHVREMCADPAILDEIERQLRAGQGCVTLLRAVDNPNDILCVIRIDINAIPWETAADLLRPQCEGQGR